MIRLFDILLSALALLLLIPVFILVSACILIESGLPILYIQERIGKDSVPFRLLKFRSMRTGSDKKGLLTIGGADVRITRVGRWLRRYKLDELPQLFNVLIGEMTLVGPRPEVRKYVDIYTTEQREILKVRPGLTDYASIQYRNENDLLAASPDPERTYIEEILPEKIRLNKIYLQDASVSTYFRILFLTVWKIFQ